MHPAYLSSRPGNVKQIAKKKDSDYGLGHTQLLLQ